MLSTRAIRRTLAHRPWPPPRVPWIMFQSWQELLFAHWPVEPGALRERVPAQLELETFDGAAWIGLTPFCLTGLRPRLGPTLPGVSTFPEMNLRTYVRVGDKPGIFFFSLDAGNRLAVAGARTFYRLPYMHATMRLERREGWIEFRSRRERRASYPGLGEAPAAEDVEAEFVGRYRPVGPIEYARPGTLEDFLTERYALYTVLRSGRVLRGEIHHVPWGLQRAEAEIERNTVAAASGISLPETAPLTHFSARQDTLVWPPMSVE